MRAWLIKALGGYPDVQSALAAAKTLPDRHAVLSEAVKKCFNTIGADDILKVREDGVWILAGKALDESRRSLLVKEAEHFSKSSLWYALQLDVKYQANKKIFSTAADEQQLVMGKMWSYTLDALSTRIKSLKKGSGVFNSKS